MPQGTIVLRGDNGHGKSNLLEAVYLMAIAKSLRTSTDKELIRNQSATQEYTRVSASVGQGLDVVCIQMDIATVDVREGNGATAHIKKHFKVDGIPRKAAEIIGYLSAVLFTAHDLDLVYGSPAIRRRYLDILISQSDKNYLKSVQKYQKVLYQRNHLLKLVRDRRASVQELEFWDQEISNEASFLIHTRWNTVEMLSALGATFHKELSDDDEVLELVYRPNIRITSNGSIVEMNEQVSESFKYARDKDIHQGVTSIGPHRDDMDVLINGAEAAKYASRGQSRTAVLAMKLAEARHLANLRRSEPIILLDDAFSELDSSRQALIFAKISEYIQCFITTTDDALISNGLPKTSSVFEVRHGVITSM